MTSEASPQCHDSVPGARSSLIFRNRPSRVRSAPAKLLFGRAHQAVPVRLCGVASASLGRACRTWTEATIRPNRPVVSTGALPWNGHGNGCSSARKRWVPCPAASPPPSPCLLPPPHFYPTPRAPTHPNFSCMHALISSARACGLSFLCRHLRGATAFGARAFVDLPNVTGGFGAGGGVPERVLAGRRACSSR